MSELLKNLKRQDTFFLLNIHMQCSVIREKKIINQISFLYAIDKNGYGCVYISYIEYLKRSDYEYLICMKEVMYAYNISRYVVCLRNLDVSKSARILGNRLVKVEVNNCFIWDGG